MFKPVRWWSEKNKLRVVFKLQFHASQVTDVTGDGLIVSIVPADSGKSTVKSDKATVVDGNCYWGNPVYETVKFNQDPKSAKIHERVYSFVLVTATSKSCIVGEASVDFSSYAESTKASSVSLPLKNSKTKATLHVSIQRMHESILDQREVKEMESVELCSKDNTIISNSIQEIPFNKKNVKRRASSVSDITISSSDGSSSVMESPWEIVPIKNDEDSVGPKSNGPIRTHNDHRSSWELSSTEESSSDVLIVGLKSDLAALSRKAETSELEMQNLRKQIAKESKRGQDLWREIVSLRDERDYLKEELKSRTSFRFDGVDIDELREELSHTKELNSNLRIQLEKTQESNSELILAVRDLDEIVEQKNRELKSDFYDDDEEQKALEKLVNGNYENIPKEANLLQRQVVDLLAEIETYKRDRDELEAQLEQLALDYEITKQANHEMSFKLEQSKIQDQLQMENECSSSSSSSEKNELDNYIENLENELERRSKELEAHVKGLEEELEKQALGFEMDIEALTKSKIEQEQRAIRAEETLKKMRWKNANTAERLQEEFRRLSVQMGSTFEANERLAMKALAEANELRLEKIRLEELLRKKSEEILVMRDENEANVAKNKILLDEMEGKKKLVREIERTRISIKEMELQVEQGNDERIEIERRVLSARREAEDSYKELDKMRFVLEEKELIIEKMQSEINALRFERDELKHSLSENEKDKDNLRKQVFELTSDLKKREMISSKPVFRGPNKDVVPNLKERIKLLEREIKLKETAIETSGKAYSDKENELLRKIEELEKTGEVDELKNEIELMKKKNESMEVELKEMEERYSDISLKFAEVEGERQQLVMDLRNLK
ncbi:hypothetical protein ABFS82_05G101700 [Erythranthe guttata]|nr:PREDICTED: myosin heavy chain, striated muscle [Erythranthe guttata]|eukprot:XP_012836293.1 PREDICTED: myosin heavy chain, striated muscle [Erythranthe guttata]